MLACLGHSQLCFPAPRIQEHPPIFFSSFEPKQDLSATGVGESGSEHPPEGVVPKLKGKKLERKKETSTLGDVREVCLELGSTLLMFFGLILGCSLELA